MELTTDSGLIAEINDVKVTEYARMMTESDHIVRQYFMLDILVNPDDFTVHQAHELFTAWCNMLSPKVNN